MDIVKMSQDRAKSHHSRALSQYASIQRDLSETIANPHSAQELSHQAMAQLNPNYKEQMTNELLNEEAIHDIIRNHNRNRDNPNRTEQMYEAIENAMKQFFDDEADIINMAERVMTQIIKEAEDQALSNKNENTGYGTGNTQTMSINEMKAQQQTRNYNYDLGDSGTSDDDDEELDRQVQETVEQGRRRASELIHIEDSLMSFLDDPREAHRMAAEILMSIMKAEPLENDDNGIMGRDTNNYQIIPYENTEEELLFLMDPAYIPPTNAIEMSNVTAAQGMATQTQDTFNNNNNNNTHTNINENGNNSKNVRAKFKGFNGNDNNNGNNVELKEDSSNEEDSDVKRNGRAHSKSVAQTAPPVPPKNARTMNGNGNNIAIAVERLNGNDSKQMEKEKEKEKEKGNKSEENKNSNENNDNNNNSSGDKAIIKAKDAEIDRLNEYIARLEGKLTVQKEKVDTLMRKAAESDKKYKKLQTESQQTESKYKKLKGDRRTLQKLTLAELCDVEEDINDARKNLQSAIQEYYQHKYNCNICMVNQKNVVLVPCGHFFCNDCVDKWKRQSSQCAICRGSIREFVKIL